MVTALPAETPVTANYDEAAVRPYTLPDPLMCHDGTVVKSAAQWENKRRGEILELFTKHVFGSAPPPTTATISARATGAALGGLAIRHQVKIEVAEGAPPINLLIYLPAEAAGRIPLVMGLNFLGNHTVANDPGIDLADIDPQGGSDIRVPGQPSGEASRGMQSDRWQVETILRRGYAFATFYYGDVFPDRSNGGLESIRPFVDPDEKCTWGAIATWAWSLSRALDYLLGVPQIDPKRVVLFGHSRHGKAALWAGAADPRFSLVISNNSGAGGASLARRNFGETIQHLVTRFPHWFSPAYAAHAGHEDHMPFDQHMLLALIAPRPLYVASAADDQWADPKGEFLSARAADPVYRLLGTSGLPAGDQPPLETPMMGTIGYHIRQGGHGVTAYDWERFLDFADLNLGSARAAG